MGSSIASEPKHCSDAALLPDKQTSETGNEMCGI